MKRYVFVPITDEILYDHPDLINGPVVPYVPGRPCHHWLSVEVNPQDELPPAQRQERVFGLKSRSQTLDAPARRSFYPS